MILVTATAGKP